LMVLPVEIAQGAKIVEIKKVPLNKPIVVVGFPGPGLIGTIVTHHLVQTAEMDLIGTIRSPFMPPISPFYGGVLRAPIRIYASKDGKLVIVISEVAVPSLSLPYFAYAICDWAQKNNATELICVEGMPKKGEGNKPIVYGAAEQDALKELIEHNIQRLPAGFVGGMPGALMNECLMRELDGISLIVEATEDVPDPAAAAEVVKALGDVRGVSTDVRSLLDQAKTIQKQLQVLATHTERVKQQDMKNSPVPIYT
jgi:uncharacterized protein